MNKIRWNRNNYIPEYKGQSPVTTVKMTKEEVKKYLNKYGYEYNFLSGLYEKKEVPRHED